MREGSERKVRPGDRLSAISATTWNKVIDSIKDFKSHRFKEGLAGRVTDEIGASNTVLIKNTTEDTFTNSYRVVGVGDPLLTADTDPHNVDARFAFEGYTPDAPITPIAILQEPAAVNDVVKGVISGYTLAYVEVIDAAHQYANPINGINTHLETVECGQAKIIKKIAGGNPPAGTTLAVIHLIGHSCDQEIDEIFTACDGTDGAWIAGLLETQCLYVSVEASYGYCTSVDDTLESYMFWDAVDGAWRTKFWNCITEAWETESWVLPAVTSPLRFFIEEGRPRLQIASIIYDLMFVCGGEGCLLFSGGTDEVCEGTPSDPPPCKDHFLVKVCCTCCPIDGWDGPGWYCITDTDCETGDITVEELFDIDACDDSIVICSCRYDNYEDAYADCGASTVLTDCCEEEVPTILSMTHDCACIPSPLVLTYNASGPNGIGWYSTTENCSGAEQYFRWWCDGVDWWLTEYCDGAIAGDGVATVQCSPYVVSAGLMTAGGSSGLCCPSGTTFSIS